MFWKGRAGAPAYDYEDVGLDLIFETAEAPITTEPATPPLTEGARISIEQHTSADLGRFATVTVMGKDANGRLFFINQII